MWISPVRDLTSKDLAMVSHYKRLKTVPPVEVPAFNSQPSINALAEQLIATLSIGMPSTVHAILGTACKLVVSRTLEIRQLQVVIASLAVSISRVREAQSCVPHSCIVPSKLPCQLSAQLSREGMRQFLRDHARTYLYTSLLRVWAFY